MKPAYSPFLLIFFFITNCADQEIVQEKVGGQCSTPAIVRDYSGLDGCGYVLELHDGTILEPVKLIVCGPPPQSAMTLDDPLHEYKTNGLNVFVDFEDFDGGSVCMVGRLVKITCISTAEPFPDSE
jgi:hypothetical protein